MAATLLQKLLLQILRNSHFCRSSQAAFISGLFFVRLLRYPAFSIFIRLIRGLAILFFQFPITIVLTRSLADAMLRKLILLRH